MSLKGVADAGIVLELQTATYPQTCDVNCSPVGRIYRRKR